jgi:hypothetical protein
MRQLSPQCSAAWPGVAARPTGRSGLLRQAQPEPTASARHGAKVLFLPMPWALGVCWQFLGKEGTLGF